MRRYGYRLALFATALALLVVLLGAWTRLTHAGLGCPDWPGCYGLLTVPTGEVQRAQAALDFPHAPLHPDKGWNEMIHRYGAGLLGLIISVLAWQAWCQRHQARQPLVLALLLVALVCAQALFGMWTVTLRLWPPVVTVHLLGGLATLSLLLVLTLRLSGTAPPAVCPTVTVRRLAWLAVAFVVGQIVLGGWVSTHYAAMACPDLPTCQGQWWPATDFASAFLWHPPIGPDYLGGLHGSEARTAIHMAHRLGALLVSLVVLALCWQLKRAGWYRLALLLGAALLLQVALGLGNVLAQVPPWLALAHSAGAALLLQVMTLVHYRLWQAGHVTRGGIC
ncbi:COX15/CtaA family protein [Pseudomonas syringae]|nr:COX15/CtaA family protein [Pseudomonas syringae]MBD8788191.1 COX15/CtaA family protein [Pseudomonas syringae]MBD8799610.1 COX15/CtaA family protein [Pseudomonas syringae]MBD8812690.1 COX15/CtaA family protein [Pseudomonas syringae]